jgi:hypothetical protein
MLSLMLHALCRSCSHGKQFKQQLAPSMCSTPPCALQFCNCNKQQYSQIQCWLGSVKWWVAPPQH